MTKKIIKIIYFTGNGEKLAGKIENSLGDFDFVKYIKGRDELNVFSEEAFSNGTPLIFIGAAGIAVRTIAPFAKDKLKDPPVIVIDELGQFVIPILSGHYGGGNKLAEEIADAMGGIPVITTATDINKAFSVDVFAKEQGLEIKNREGIARVSTNALKGKPITLSIKDYPPKEKVDVLITDEDNKLDGDDNPEGTIYLTSGTKSASGGSGKEPFSGSPVDSLIDGLIVGIGCKKGKPYEELKYHVENSIRGVGYEVKDINAIATIDIKEEEECIKILSHELNVPILSFDADILSKVEGEFSASEFVKENVGVDNVCERAVMAAAGSKGKLILKKKALNGITVAAALANPHSTEHSDSISVPSGEVSGKNKNIIYVVGMGPGSKRSITEEARCAILNSEVVIGYTVYLDLLKEEGLVDLSRQELKTTPMKQEIDRCRMCIEEASNSKSVAMVCSGDAGVYGMASIMYELLDEGGNEDIDLEIIPGITAAISGAAVLGAPLNHDFAVISLSDLLTPWEKIENRLRAAAEGDFAMAIYNPSSKKRHDFLEKACYILLETISDDRPCGYVKNIGRQGTEYKVCTLGELKDEKVDMFTTVFIGNSQTKIIDGKLVTPRGYNI